MVYPSKTNRDTIISATLSLVEREGAEALTLRRLAAEIGVTANAIYRYFRSLEVLVAAAADAVAKRLHNFVESSMANWPPALPPDQRVRRLLMLHGEFTTNNPSLYRILFSASREAEAELPTPHWRGQLFLQSMNIIAPLVSPSDATLATTTFWSLMHGIWELRRAGVLKDKGQDAIDDYAFEALIRGVHR
ncbi:TetR/AcrR family transcriptional regulator [Bordetella sp. N]|uniref:TetR/AcrR family transcriptional regulator n=1 Tax=Bordetella sp. N TaxID=1746199 RepID=UPI00070DF678|nr:TetR/AcrR family transcriptional regulator [Bordetella sp. N]ALM84223.1 hypothetical protein ASB57_15695 [Bordetella sp. N]